MIDSLPLMVHLFENLSLRNILLNNLNVMQSFNYTKVESTTLRSNNGVLRINDVSNDGYIIIQGVDINPYIMPKKIQ